VKRAISALVLLAAFVVVVGCTTTSVGEPRPQVTSTGASDATGSPGSGDLPSRPREIRLDDVDPCKLIPEADRSEYYIDEPGEAGADDEDNAECTWVGTEVGYFGYTLDVSEGIETRLDGSYTVVGDIADPILGFGVVTYALPGDEGACFAAVDVADGQQLIATVGINKSDLDNVPPLCEYAHQFAASAMETLVES
jgi:hypothetical protein